MAEPFDDERGRLEEAYDPNHTPAIRPDGPQQVTIDERPMGALAVAVRRDLAQVRQQIGRLAAAMGDEFYYRWPVKTKNKETGQYETDWVEGISVKGTNACARIYGNCAVQVRAHDLGNHWMIVARFADLETGYVLERPFQQRKGQNIGGQMDGGRALDIVFQIGVSKATRNVVDNAITEFTDYAFQEARHAIIDKVGKEPDKFRARILARLQELKIGVDRVERRHGRTYEKWLAHDMALIIAEIQAINDNMAHPDEMFPPEVIVAPARPTQDGVVQTEQGQAAKDPKDAGATAKQGPTPEQASATAETVQQSPRQEPDPAQVLKGDEAVEQEQVQEDSPAFKAASDMIGRLEAQAKGDSALDIAEFKKKGRANIDNYPELSEDEREMLRGRFTTFALELQRARTPKKRK